MEITQICLIPFAMIRSLSFHFSESSSIMSADCIFLSLAIPVRREMYLSPQISIPREATQISITMLPSVQIGPLFTILVVTVQRLDFSDVYI